MRLFHAAAPLDRFLGRLLQGTLLPQGRTIAVATSGRDAAHRLDDSLWRQPDDTSFIPHCVAGDPLEADTPVVITWPGAPPAAHREILVSVVPEVPADARGYADCAIVIGERIDAHPQLAGQLEEMEAQGHTVKRFDVAAEAAARRRARGG